MVDIQEIAFFEKLGVRICRKGPENNPVYVVQAKELAWREKCATEELDEAYRLALALIEERGPRFKPKL